MGPRAIVGIKCPEEIQVLIPMPTLPILQLRKLKLNLKCVLTEHFSHLSPTTTVGSYEYLQVRMWLRNFFNDPLGHTGGKRAKLS